MPQISTWSIDPAHSGVEFAVKHLMITTVRGRFKRFSGTITVNEEDLDRSTVEVEIDAASIDTGNEDRDRHLRTEDFLDVERHPKITFRSREIRGASFEEGTRFRVKGDLTIRGESMEVELEAMFGGRGPDAQGNERVGFSVNGTIDRRDWGLRWNRTIETGGLLVANEVRIEIDVQAIRQETAGREAA